MPVGYNSAMDTQQLTDVKAQVRNVIKRHQAELRILAHQIHSNPETAMNEYNAAGWLTEALETRGFAVERGDMQPPDCISGNIRNGETRGGIHRRI